MRERVSDGKSGTGRVTAVMMRGREKNGENGKIGADWQKECLSFCSSASFLICKK